MPKTPSREYIERIANWQAETGCTGAPPVSFDKKLSNWVQFCRTVGRRGQLNRKVSEAFAALGISIDRGPTDAHSPNAASYADPRGFVPDFLATASYIEEKRETPSLRSCNEHTRHQASWLIRLQAGILPANSMGFTAPAEHQLLPERVLDLAAHFQSPRDMVAEWLLWCARAQCALDRPTPGNNWLAVIYVGSHALLTSRCPDLVVLSERVRRGEPVQRWDIPDPNHFRATLSEHTSTVTRPVKRVAFSRESIYGRPLDSAIETVTSRDRHN